MGDKATNASRNSAFDLVQGAHEKLTRLACDSPSSTVAEPRKRLLSKADGGQTNDDGTLVSSAETLLSPPSVPVKNVEEMVAIGSDKKLDQHLISTPDVSAVDEIVSPFKNSILARRRCFSTPHEARSGVAAGGSLAPAAKEMENARCLPEEWGTKVARSQQVVRSRSRARFEKRKSGHSQSDHRSTVIDDITEMTSATDADNYPFAHEQPEHEMDNDIGSVKFVVADEDYPGLLSSNEDEETSEDVTSGESSMDEEMLMIIPAEFQTARSFDEDNSTLSLHPVAGLLDSLRVEQPDKDRVVETLEAMKEALEMSTARIIVDREGLLTLMELVWRDYSEACTMHALGYCSQSPASTLTLWQLWLSRNS
uniref:Uncharacterized protein n=1 Tax=Hyaloperonospora arabidopsidis (strain Emoy2) TaxID=559515 RepID=M4B672_HYAAE